MDKVKLVSGKEVQLGDKVFYVNKEDVSDCFISSYMISNSVNIEENENWSETFATKQEAEEWIEKYKQRHIKSKIPEDLKKYPLTPEECYKPVFNPQTVKEFMDNVENGYLYESEKLEIIKPNYYKGKSGQDVLDVIEDFDLDFYVGNICKYIIRSGKKDKETTIQDLLKAKEYIDRKIKSLENSIC